MKEQKILLKRIFNTLFMIFVLRIGTFIPIPHVDQRYINQALNSNLLFQICNNTTEPRVGILSLGLIPYINASILIQCLTGIIPNLEKLQEEGEEGRRKIKYYTRSLTTIFAITQSYSISQDVQSTIFNWNIQIQLEIILSLLTGALICLWISEKISEKGLGNGTSIMIALNILASVSLKQNNLQTLSQSLTINQISLFLLITMGIVFIQEAIRQLPLVSAKQLFATQIKTDSKNTYLPLRINQGGVMPIIFASTFINSLGQFSNLLLQNITLLPLEKIQVVSFLTPILITTLRFSLILGSTFIYSLLILNPKEITKELNKMAVTILKVRPGKQTEHYLERTIKRLATLGAIFLALLLNIPNVTTSIISATSFLIIISVIIEIERKVLTLLFTNTYQINKT